MNLELFRAWLESRPFWWVARGDSHTQCPLAQYVQQEVERPVYMYRWAYTIPGDNRPHLLPSWATRFVEQATLRRFMTKGSALKLLEKCDDKR
jgi:hypothetical protein